MVAERDPKDAGREPGSTRAASTLSATGCAYPDGVTRWIY